jgi:L-Ala-D/L-Glu epimerase
VAGDVENLAELLIASESIDTAGEMNGFLKPSSRLLRDPYEVVRGSAVVRGGYVPEVDWELVAAHAVDRVTAHAFAGRS